MLGNPGLINIVITASELGSPKQSDTAQITFSGDPRSRACGDDGGGACGDNGGGMKLHGRRNEEKNKKLRNELNHSRAYQ